MDPLHIRLETPGLKSCYVSGIVFEKKRFHLGKKAKILAVLFGLALAGCVGFGLYLAGVFNDAPKLPDAVEG